MARFHKFGAPAVFGVAALIILAAPASADDQGTPTGPAPGPAASTDPVQHLSSPQNLPPGTYAATADMPAPTGPGRLDYLRELWQAVQTREISGGNALMLLTTQMPLDTPAQGLPNAPQAPPGAPAPAPDQVAP